jgi:3-oxoacyl-[acyl-carrier protein] reductase
MPGVAVVTGAARGIGYAVAHRLVSDGWSVVISDKESAVHAAAARLGEDVPGGAILGLRCDVLDPVQVGDIVTRTRERFGSLELVVANAGVGGGNDHLADLTLESFDQVVAVNLRGCFLTVRAAARIMREQRRGSIVMVGSVYGRVPVPGAAAYSAAKAGVTSLTKTAALELGPYGITVNAVAPGFIDTPMRWAALESRAEASAADAGDLYAHDIGTVPLRRYGTGADVAGAVAFLAGEDARYITGHVIDVNGGLVVWAGRRQRRSSCDTAGSTWSAGPLSRHSMASQPV